MHEKDLKSFSNEVLLARLAKLVRQSRRVESVLVAHVAEVDARRLFASEGFSSMFAYCTDGLHLSEAEAYLRIEAARASRRHPVLLTMLGDGRLHLSGIAVLAPHLKKLAVTDAKTLLARATHQGKRAIKELVAELAPKPDVAPSIRKVPQQKAETLAKASSESQPASEEPTPSGRSSSESPQNLASKPRDHRAKVEPLAPARYIVQFTASAALRDKLSRLEALMPGRDLAAMVEAAVSEKLERLETKRFGTTNKPRKTLEEADTSPGVRAISAPVRRFVTERDGGRCTFVSKDGRRCSARENLEFHHVEPYGQGGDRSAGNIKLMCKTHNLYLAEMDYGKEKIDPYRRSGDRVGEPAPTFELRPDGARVPHHWSGVQLGSHWASTTAGAEPSLVTHIRPVESVQKPRTPETPGLTG